jgi:hypothetical protein
LLAAPTEAMSSHLTAVGWLTGGKETAPRKKEKKILPRCANMGSSTTGYGWSPSHIRQQQDRAESGNAARMCVHKFHFLMRGRSRWEDVSFCFPNSFGPNQVSLSPILFCPVCTRNRLILLGQRKKQWMDGQGPRLVCCPSTDLD